MLQIWPAIDLRGGKCVRLAQGDFARETIYADDPATMAQAFEKAGASYLHIVDLDAARDGKLTNIDAIASILKSVSMTCEIGGGVRDDATIERLLEMGLSRLVVGTAALKQPDWFLAACNRWPNRLSLGLDAKEGFVATEGWLEKSSTRATELLKRFNDAPIASVIYTDVATDGMLTGPNFEELETICDATDIPVIASGGIANAGHILQLTKTRAAGCITGRAIYEGTLTIEEALAASQGEPEAV